MQSFASKIEKLTQRGGNELLTARCRRILIFLANLSDPIRLQDVADRFGISLRMVKYDLEMIREWLQLCQETPKVELKSQTRKGIWLSADAAGIQKLLEKVGEPASGWVFFQKEERLRAMGISLLSKDDWMTVQELADEVGVSQSTLRTDLVKVEENLALWGLKLLRQIGKGLMIAGPERQRRLALESLFQEFITPEESRHFQDGSCDSVPVSTKLTRMVKHFLMFTREELIEISSLSYSIERFNDWRDGAFWLRVVILLHRLKQGHTLTGWEGDSLSQWVETDEYLEFRNWTKSLKPLLGAEIPPLEVASLCVQWLALKRRMIPQDLPNQEATERILAAALIKAVGRQTNEMFEGDQLLLNSLSDHLDRVFRLYTWGALSPNPLLGEILESYPNLFHAVQQGCNEVLSLQAIHLREGDVAYLVLYFQAALERQRGENKLMALVVCATGHGNAQLLGLQLANKIPFLEVIGTCDPDDLVGQEKKLLLDVVVSTLPIQSIWPVVVVPPIPTQAQWRDLYRKFEELRGGETVIDYLEEEPEPHPLSLPRENEQDTKSWSQLTRDIIFRGFQMGVALQEVFRDRLTDSATAALSLHMTLMTHREVFGPLLPEGKACLSPQELETIKKVRAVLAPYAPALSDSEAVAIIRYFSEKEE